MEAPRRPARIADAGSEKDFDTGIGSLAADATYVNFVSMGQYQLKRGIDHGLPYVYAVSEQLSVEDRRKAFAALMTSGERIRTLEAMFGPYPFSEIGGIVPVHQLPFGGLETQTRPIYDAKSILNAGFEPGRLDHELAHMLFGDKRHCAAVEHIFISEGYARGPSGARERRGGRKAMTP